jgi:hypothetical protein
MKTLNYIRQPLFAACAFAILLFVSSAPAQNVGIGVSNPQSKLSVNGTTASGGLAVGDTTYTSTSGTVAPANGAMIQGFVGIGTTKPVSPLNVVAEGSNGGTSDDIRLESYGPTHAPALYMVNARGTYAAPTNLANGDSLGVWEAAGFINGALANTSGIFLTYKGDGTTDLTDISFMTSGANRMYLDPQGNLGIGTGTPLAPLHVTGNNNITQNNLTETFFNASSTTTLAHSTGVNGANIASAIFAATVWSGTSFVSYSGSITASDARLKNIIGHSDSAKDLETLKKIEITDYTMKDVLKEGDAPLKKVVAQQVEKVYPTAIKTIGYKGVTFTPDIYAVSSAVKSDGQNAYTISLAKTHGLKEGETVRLITEKNPELNVVAHVVDDRTLTVTTKEAIGDKVFVYGKECLDLKGVDYDAIAMLNVSATQELAKKVEALEAENAKLKGDADRLTTIGGEEKAKMVALETEVASLKAMSAEMATLKQAIASLQIKAKSTIRPVALNQ